MLRSNDYNFPTDVCENRQKDFASIYLQDLQMEDTVELDLLSSYVFIVGSELRLYGCLIYI